MTVVPPAKNPKWYRSPVSKADFAILNRRSDLKGFLQAGGYVGVLILTGTAACLAVGHLTWPAIGLLLFVHGTCCHFSVNAFHELVHESVFKTKALNRIFLWIVSFIGHHNHIWFWASHTEHHKFTLHPPHDREVVLPQMFTLKQFLREGFVDPMGAFYAFRNHIRTSYGRIDGEWTHYLFDDQPEKRRQLVRWARIQLLGHGAIIAVSCYFHLWMIPVVTTFSAFYGGALQFLCNNAQHVGLRDNVADFRLCCRTNYLNPVFQFLFWHMNYHIEHHMYAAVPCYNLGKLHRLIKADLPPTPNGLYQTWAGICAIIKRQRTEPGYQYTAELPAASAPPAEPAADPQSPAEDAQSLATIPAT